MRYLNGELTEDEMIELEVRRLSDDTFNQRFKIMRLLFDGIEHSASKTSKSEKINRLNNPHSNDAKSNSVIQLNPWMKLIAPLGIIAAGVLLLILLYPNLFAPQLSPQEMYAAYFKVSPNIGLQASRGSTAPMEALEAYEAYDRRDYPAAIAKFEELIPASRRRMTDLFHLGNCYLAVDIPKQAATALEEVANSNSRLAEDAKWYLALAYLRLEDYLSAKKLLGEIATPIDRVKMAERIQNKLPDY